MILPVWKYKLTHSQGIKRHGVHVSMFGVANIIQSRKSFLWCRNGQMTTRSDALAWSLVSWVKMCPTSLHFKSVMQIYVRSNCKYNSLLVQIRNCAIVCVRPRCKVWVLLRRSLSLSIHTEEHGLTRPGNFPAIIPDCAGLCNSRRLCCQHNVLLCGILAGFAKSVLIADCVSLCKAGRLCCFGQFFKNVLCSIHLCINHYLSTWALHFCLWWVEKVKLSMLGFWLQGHLHKWRVVGRWVGWLCKMRRGNLLPRPDQDARRAQG